MSENVSLPAFPHRVNFMCNHPLTGDILYSGDVVMLPEAVITDAQRADSLFSRMPEGTPVNHITRDKEDIVGVTISEEQYDARIALAALNSKVQPGFSPEAKATNATIPRR